MEQVYPKPQSPALKVLHHYYRTGILEAVTSRIHRVTIPQPYPKDLDQALWYSGIWGYSLKGEYELSPTMAEMVYPFVDVSPYHLNQLPWFKPFIPFRSSGYIMATYRLELVWVADDVPNNVKTWYLEHYLHCLQWEGFISLQSCQMYTQASHHLTGKSPWKQFRDVDHAIVRLFVNKEAVA